MRKSSLGAFVGLAGLLLADACSLLFPVPDGSEPLDAGVDGTIERPDAPPLDHAGDADALGTLCPDDARGPPLVQIDTYCIDRTEVTVAQYQEFQDAGVPLAAQPAGCESNPGYQLFPLRDGAAPAPDTPALVDECEAYVYCRWAGKRLCGAVDGGPLRFENPLNPDAAVDLTQPKVDDREQNQWLHACAGPEGTVYPYGNDFEPDACVPGRPVGQPGCEGGYPGIFDFVGNDGEWIDSCRDLGCGHAGGPTCRDHGNAIRVAKTKDDGVLAGIRCCWP
jgi:hypothetical protein